MTRRHEQWLSLLFLAGFGLWFTWDLIHLKVYLNHPTYTFYFQSYRRWFLERLMHGELPLWNPYWGIGNATDIEAAVPVDIFTPLEWIIGHRYYFFHLPQAWLVLFGVYGSLRLLRIEPFLSRPAGSLLFFAAPWVSYHLFYPWIISNVYVGSALSFALIVRRRFGWLVVVGALTLLGTRLEYWMFYFVFCALTGLATRRFVPTARGLGAVFLLHAWQIWPLYQLLAESGRTSAPGLASLVDVEFYRRIVRSAGLTLERAGWFAELAGPVGAGAVTALVAIVVRFRPRPRLVAGVVATFLVVAYYWYRAGRGEAWEIARVNYAPAAVRFLFGAACLLGAWRARVHPLARVACLLVVVLYLVRDEGQVMLTHLIGVPWIPTRENFLFDFLFVLLGCLGARAVAGRRARWVGIAAALVVTVTLARDPYQAQWEEKPAPPGLGAYSGLAGAAGVVAELRDGPTWRGYFAAPGGWEATSLVTSSNEVTLYSSLLPARYLDWALYRRYGVRPEEHFHAHPGGYTPETLATLPPRNTRGFDNDVAYVMRMQAQPPADVAALRILGVRHVMALDPIPSAIGLVDYRRIGAYYTARVMDPLPRAFTIAVLPPAPRAKFADALDARIEGDRLALSRFTVRFRANPIARYEPEHVVLDVDNDEPRELVLTDLHHPFWEAYVDGRPAAITPALHLFRGVRVPAGRHVVDFRCRIPYWPYAIALSVGTLGALILSGLSRRTWQISARRNVSPVPNAT